MPRPQDTLLKIRVKDPKGNFLGGKVDVELTHRALREHAVHRGLDASLEIRVRGLRRKRSGDYLVTVTPAGGLRPQMGVVSVPPSGIATLEFVFPAATAPPQPSGDDVYVVTGKVSCPDRAVVAGLLVMIVDKNVAKDVPLVDAATDPRGNYEARFSASQLVNKTQPDLQARVFSQGKLLGASEIRYDAALRETLDVILPAGAAALVSEHEALTGAIAGHFSGSLRDLQETDDRPDVSYLANKTGWDARAVALAALADQFSQNRSSGRSGAAGEGLPAPFYYALFRAGLPANADTLYHADSQAVTRIWKESIGQGVIPKELEAELPRAMQAFQGLSADKLLSVPAPAGVSALKDMLAVSRLGDSQQQQFAALYAANRTDLPAFWRSVSEAFGADVSNRLQVDGKMAFLTLNNAPLMQQLQSVGGAGGLSDPVQLAQAGFYRASEWAPVLAAGIPIPDQIPGDTAAAKQANYAQYLAAQVRLSYPTAAVAHMVQAGDLPVGAAGQVHDFLTVNQGKFEIGIQPVEQYIQRNGLAIAAETVTEVKRLQRLYQITPGDQEMSALLKRGIDSAFHVTRYDKESFLRDFAPDLGGNTPALQIYHRSAQVYNAVLNIAISYLTARNGITLGAQPLRTEVAALAPAAVAPGGGGQVIQPEPKGGSADVIAYPTLEGLFGEMDFCACDECRSILSPAAYLVDLLNFADQPAPPARTENPQAVLLERRPDIQHLPLTCENTNTVLPYIDVVNETLEYFIANDVQKFSLNGYVGHDTNGAASADLLASAQFVNDSAYATLQKQRFPAPLPFHQPLENLRRHFEKFEVPLPLAMERLRVHDKLEHGAAPYGWRDILMEELRLSRDEYQILTDSAGNPLWRIYGFPNGTADADVIAGISNAKQFSRRLDISYEDLVSILKTRFVNPDSDLIPKVERLGVPIAALVALKNGTITGPEFDSLLPVGAGALDPAEYGADGINAWVTQDANFDRIMGLIVLTDPSNDPASDPCDFDILELRHARPTTGPDDTSTRLGAAEFVRILRFIRLWWKTGWTIEQTDATICALFREDLAPMTTADVDTVDKLDAGFLILLPRMGIVRRVMPALNLSLNRDLLALLAVWSPLGTHGDHALYRQMFLNPALLDQDAVFADNGFGEFLQDNTQKLLAHAEALRSAFNLTGDEFDRIVAALGFDANTTLDIANISAIFRRGWLSRKMALSIREVLLLVQFTGLDPFAPPDLTDPAILRLQALARALKDRGLKATVALYLIWNQDLSGKSAPDPAQVAELVRMVRGDFVLIEDQFAVTDDPSGDIARARMALVYGTDPTTTFFALLDDTLALDVPYTNPQPKLKPSITAADPRIAYDDFRHRLSYTGVFTPQRRHVLKSLPAIPAVFKPAVDALFDRSEDITGSFFARYPELKPLYDDFLASPDPIEKKRKQLLAGFRPELSRRRKRQQVLQRLSAAVSVGLDFVEAIADPPSPPFPLHAAEHPNRPALNDFLALDRLGLATQFFFRNTATGTIDQEIAASDNLSYSPNGGNPLPVNPNPGHAVSGIWRGSIEAPETGFLNIVIEADTTANVTLTLAGQARAMTQNGAISRNTEPIELTAGVLYEIIVTVERVRDVVAIKWETATRPREVIPGRYLYPPSVLGPFSDTYTRFIKAASLALALKITANELAHFATRHEYRIGGDEWLNVLTITGDPNPVTAAALLEPLEAIVAFSRVKAEISPDDESLLTILKDPAAATATADSLLFTLTRWDLNSLTDVLSRFKEDIAGLARFQAFLRVYDAFTLIRAMGIGAGALIAATTNNPAADTVRNLQGALRARYDANDWRDLVQPINDAMRGLQRDALVAYILHHFRNRPATASIDTADKLFEYFLMDVQMEPCMQTSRIRHALSSAQLFIERCLMNLEPRVSPESLNASQWEWMKRYRVWEANRKIFLFPENWLEPELRDDKSPFFKEIESELLQTDITDDSAAIAILNYLSKLEEVAKLTPCGIYHLEGDLSERTGNVDHVVARTSGAHRKYFYRRREFGYWTPWEQIKLDIEDNPCVPVVWQGRLLLFWLKVVKEGPKSGASPKTGADQKLTDLHTTHIPDDPKVNTKALLAWSEYYNAKWQPAKTSDVALPSSIVSAVEAEGAAFVRKNLSLSFAEAPQTAPPKQDKLRVAIEYQGSTRTSFIFYNTHSSPVGEEDQGSAESFNPPVTDRRQIYPIDAYLLISYYAGPHTVPVGPPSYDSTMPRLVAIPQIPFTTTEPHHPLTKPFEAPFFVDDRRHVFFVSTTKEPVWIADFPDYGVSVNPGFADAVKIPPLVLELPPIPIGPEFWGDGGPIIQDPGVVDPVGIQQFVTEDIHISQGIGTAGPVTYGGKQMGPSGPIIDVNRGGGFGG
jgi:hypothetical protein